jgi:hypothetical protein
MVINMIIADKSIFLRMHIRQHLNGYDKSDDGYGHEQNMKAYDFGSYDIVDNFI